VPAAKRVVVKGKPMVLPDEAAYQALLPKADLWEPELPAPDADGNSPALEALAVLRARAILRARRRLGLSQAELARRARIRPAGAEQAERADHCQDRPGAESGRGAGVTGAVDPTIPSWKELRPFSPPEHTFTSAVNAVK
jgi:hypothetical protein